MKFAIVFAAVLLLAGCAKKSAPVSSTNNATQPKATISAPDVTLSIGKDSMDQAKRTFPGILSEPERLNQQATITLASGNVITFEIFGDEAPKAASNFIALAKEKFYDNLTFHRVEPGFVVQGGDPKGNGTGGPGYQFEDEPVTRDYSQGIVAMANSGPNTNGSQFFILLADTPLPKLYTIFGRVTSGFEHVQAIKKGDAMKTVVILPQS